MRIARRSVVLWIAGVAATWGAPSEAYDEVEVSSGGAVSGVVRYSDEAPPPVPLKIDKDKEVCGKTPKVSEELIVGKDRGLKNVVVSVEKIGRGKKITVKKIELANKDCRYEPHVQAATVGAILEVVNADPVLHNTHLFRDDTTVFNVALPTPGLKVPRKLKQPGIVQAGCDAGHHWMSAYIVVLEHPYYAVSDAAGKFSIPELPPGNYTLNAWHQKLGKKTATVTIEAEKTASVDFQF